MRSIFKILAYIIYILTGLYSFISSLSIIAYLFGSGIAIAAFILAPLSIVFFPWYIGIVYGEWSLLVITYGGGIIGWIFYSIGKKPNEDTETESDRGTTPYKQLTDMSKVNREIYENKAKYNPGDRVITRVVGVTFEGRQEIIAKVQSGHRIVIVREPENPYDSNAVKIMTNLKPQYEIDRFWRELKEHPFNKELQEKRREYVMNETIGYLNRDLARLLAPILDEYKLGLGNINGDILEITNVPNVNTNIGVVIGFTLPTKEELIRSKKLAEWEKSRNK